MASGTATVGAPLEAVPSIPSVTVASFEAAYEPTPRTRAFEVAYTRTPRLTVLGRGAFGVTFAVHSSKDPQFRYAAKEIPVAQLSDRKRREALAESTLLRTLTHRNIVACVDTFLTGSNLYIIMECATSGDLARQISSQRDTGQHFPEDTIMMVFAQICSALAYIHRRKIIHRDLKPANVFLFGCHTSRPYGRKSDVWSLGVVLYELACLSLPFAAKVVPAVARMICLTEPKPLPEQYSDELGALVRSLLQKDPNNRPAAAAILSDPYVQHFIQCEADPGAICSDIKVDMHVSGRGPVEGATEDIGSTDEPITAASSNREKIKEIFRDHDAVGCGSISIEQLMRVFLRVAPDLTCTGIARILAAADGKHGDAMDYAEFLEWLYH